MVLLWMILLEVLLCAEAENVTEVRGQLGAEVTLTCSNESSDTYWFMEIHSQLRGCIGYNLSQPVSTYHPPDFGTKFSILGTKLVIKNLTAEDCRLYFCGIRRDGSIQFVETFCLVSGVTLPNNNPQNNCIKSQLIIMFVSAVGFIVLLISFLFVLLCLKSQNYSNQGDDISLHIYDVPELPNTSEGKDVHSRPANHH